VIAYKFLRPGRRGPFSDFAWPQGEWVEADGPLEECRSGIHACRPGQLAYWLGPELWELELDGEIVEAPLKLVARRGRLARPVAAWDDAARLELGEECVRRIARYAVLELRELGLEGDGERLEHAGTVAELAAVASRVAETARGGDAADLAAFVGDALGYAEAGHVAAAAFIAAHAAELHSPVGVDDPFGAERAEQSRWLAARLRLVA
jgi:hypothetical protein